eukprot:Blabericola_migrator_1__5512@NODE_2811_length_2328_cov_5_685980_g1761_i0_p1_GENE_NODE_2811_length_2328_cov_5_685980_g1761_i0NODE_2811_length_2328_cov_5_685980_g1761_i0_p1_ORF_typecomplete_len121_score2_78Monooxygenase_B/PF04744_12/0_098Glyoxalase_2/PF12681_7/0_14_NODE_2811_length_2328_cov_5_685980_g1761_i011651527
MSYQMKRCQLDLQAELFSLDLTITIMRELSIWHSSFFQSTVSSPIDRDSMIIEVSTEAYKQQARSLRLEFTIDNTHRRCIQLRLQGPRVQWTTEKEWIPSPQRVSQFYKVDRHLHSRSSI